MGYIREIYTAVKTTIPGLHAVPTADVVTNTRMRDVIGNKADAAASGVATATDSLAAYIKQLVNANVLAASAFGTILAKSTVVSSGIPNNTQTGGTIFTATGDVLIEDITFNTGTTGLANPTNIEISTNNVAGKTGAAAPIFVEVISSFGANLTVSKKEATSHTLPMLLESGKSLFIHGDDAAGTGAGTATITLIGKAITAGASVAASNIAGA
jgi:hypothetical protein